MSDIEAAQDSPPAVGALGPPGLGPLRVLACAYACNPSRGSEDAVGWNWVRAIAAHHQVTVLTAAFHRADIELWRLGLPLVWGPLGGIENTAWRLLWGLGPSALVFLGARNLVNSVHRRWLRGPPQALRAAGPGVIAAISGIRAGLLHWYGADSTVVCEVTAPPLRVGPAPGRAPGEPLRIAWSGAHIAGKALPLLLEALTKLDADMAASLRGHSATV